MQSSRRALLASVGSGTVLLSGCSRFSSAQSREAPEPDELPESGVDELPDPSRHVHGANGEWSSFGCNAANTRTVADGEAPADGVSERWRVEVTPMTRQEPVAAGGRVYLPDGRELSVFDADDGTELWSLEDAREPPLVWEDVVYVSTIDGVRALEAETGDELWERAVDVPGSATTPVVIGGWQLICAFGERVVALDPEDGSVRWHRDVFGRCSTTPRPSDSAWSSSPPRRGWSTPWQRTGSRTTGGSCPSHRRPRPAPTARGST